MKLQSFGIIFALVALPLILVLTYYIQLQVDSIEIQSQYDTQLLDSTYDAMSSFEINTANEDLSSVSDSLRTIIEASANVFMNTLATNFGMSNASKSYVEQNIPALLYTLYDGYYIYAPTKVPTVLTKSDGTAVAVGDLGVTLNANGTYSYEEIDEESAEWLALSNDEKLKRYVHYDDLKNFSRTEDYGQLLYEKADGTYTANIGEAKFNNKNVLKSYMPFSARYKQQLNGKDADLTIVYTLDNYVTIEGSIGDEYYTKSGYLISRDSVKVYVDDDPNIILKYNQETAKELIESGAHKIKVEIVGEENSSFEIEPGDSVQSLQEKINTENTNLDNAQNELAGNTSLTDDAKNTLKSTINTCHERLNEYQYRLDLISAAIYYAKAEIFSDWVYSYVGDLRENALVEISGQNYESIKGIEQVTYDFSGSDAVIFNVEGETVTGKTEIAIDSNFYTHKINVIRNSIQYNLNLAMSTYNMNTTEAYSYSMPVMTNDEWQQILSNVSIVSFMQGMKCGLKTYNNYMIVSSTNNEIVTSPEHIYYVQKDNFNDENTEYHSINCQKLMDADSVYNPVGSGGSGYTQYLSFSSKEVKYDKIYDKYNTILPYKYDHKNLACYDCVNDGNYNTTNIFDETNSDYTRFANLRRAYYIAVAKERNDIYKMNAVENSEGYEIIYENRVGEGTELDSNYSKLPLSDIKAIEVVIGTVKTTDRNETTLSYRPYVGTNSYLNDTIYSMASNSTKEYTMYIEVDPNEFGNSTDKVSKNKLHFDIQAENSTSVLKDDTLPEGDYKQQKDAVLKASIKYIRVIYK